MAWFGRGGSPVVQRELATLGSDASVAVVVGTGRRRPPWVPGGARVFAVPGEADALRIPMAVHGPYDLVVDASPPRRARHRLLPVLLHQLRAGGTLVLLDAVTGPAPVADLLVGGPEQARLAPSIGSVDLEGDALVVTGRLRAYAAVGEDEVDALLAGPDGPRGHRLAVVEGVTYPSRCVVEESPSPRAGGKPATITAPTMSLRSYEDVVVAPGQLVVQDDLLLPASFRRPFRPRLKSLHALAVAHRYAVLRDPLDPPRVAEGGFFHLDTEFPGHYGHLVTEQLARLWGWSRSKATDPDLRLLLGDVPRPYQRLLLDAAGVAARDTVVMDRPLRVDRLVAASPMFCQPAFVHPALADLWREVGDRLAAAAPESARPRRIFCTRTGTKRACHQTVEVEKLFAAAGFAVVRPEELDLPSQVRMFREARVVAGFAGAAMFTSAFCDEPKDVVLVSSESYTAENEYLIASVLGHRLHVAWCTPDVARPSDGFSRAAYQSDFTFDDRREGAWLRRRLAELD